MGVLDDIKEALSLGPNDWKERLAATVELVSPTGATFSALWQKSPRTVEKKLGIYSYPKVKGEIVKDLEVNSDRYEFSIYFEGANNDLDGARFFQACKERGTWVVTHPVHGALTLQLVSVTETDDPTDSGNVTQLATKWIEPINEATLQTARQMVGATTENVKDLNISGAQQFADNVSQLSAELVQDIRDATNIATGIIDTATRPLFDTLDALDNVVNAIQSAIQTTLTATTIATQGLSGQIQNLISAPTGGTGGVAVKTDAFASLISGLTEQLPTAELSPYIDTAGIKNRVAVFELALVAAKGALATIVTSATLNTRAEALSAADAIVGLSNQIDRALDGAQTAFNLQAIDDQYFSQAESFATGAKTISDAERYLLLVAPDLSIERRFTLDRPRAPIEITITEYGGLGPNDSTLDLFLESNGLKGTEIVMLDRGREVVVYG